MFSSLVMTKKLSQLQTLSRAQRQDLQWVYFLLTLSATMTYLMASDEAHSDDADVNTLDTLEDAEDPILLAENPTDSDGENIGETDPELEDETENTPEQGNTTENTNRDRPFIDANPIFNPAFFSSDRGTAFNLMLKAIFGTPLDPKEQQNLASILSKLGVSPGSSFRDIFEPTQIFPTEDDAPAPPSLTVDVSGPTSFNLLTAIATIPGVGAVTPAVLANILMGQPSVTIPTPFADVTIDAAGNVTIVPNAGIIPFDDGETAMTTVNIPLILPDGTIFNLPLNLNIAGMNDAPIIDQGDGPLAIIIAENQPGPVLQITATDPDTNDTVMFSLQNDFGGLFAIDPNTGQISTTGLDNESMSMFELVVIASDGTATDTIKINVTVTDVNDAPVLAAIGDKAVAELTPLNFTVLATDSDLPGDTLTFSLDPGAPAGTSIDPTTGVFSWVPTDAQGPGNYNITVRVTDSGNLFDTETISVVVNEIDPRILDLLAHNADLSFTGTFPPLTIQNIASQDAKALAKGTDFSIEGEQYKIDVSGNVTGTGSRTFQGVMANVPTTILLQLDTAKDDPDGFLNVRLGTTGADTSTVALRATDSQGNIVQGFDGEDVLFTGPGDDVLIGDGVGVAAASDIFIYEFDTLVTFETFGNDILPDFDQTANPDQLILKGDLNLNPDTGPTNVFGNLNGLAVFSSVSLTPEGYQWNLSEGILSGAFPNFSFGTVLLPNLMSDTLQVGLDIDADGTVDETFTYFLGDNNDNAITPSAQNYLVFGFGGDDQLSVIGNNFSGVLIGDNLGTSSTPQGNDILEGGTESDVLVGDGDFGLNQKGNDVLFGREMDDALNGDSFSFEQVTNSESLDKNGNDVFVYSYDLDNGMDTITLFDQTSITGAQDSLGLINFPSDTLDRIETRSLPINFTSPAPTLIEFNIVGPDDSDNPLGVNLGGASFIDLRIRELLESGNPQTPPDPLRIPIHYSTTGDLNDFKNIPPGMADAEVFLGTDLDTYTTEEILNGSATSDGLSAQFFFGLGGGDLITGGSGIDFIDGGDGADFILGDYVNSTTPQPFGDDKLFGGAGEDVIVGDIGFGEFLAGTVPVGGNDLIKGGPDDDSLIGDGGIVGEFDLSGGGGGTRLFGLGGTDKFVYDTAFDNGNDTILDFELNRDILVITNDLGRENPDLAFILPDFAIEDGEYVFKLQSGPFSQNFAQTVNHGTATLENITPEANSIVKTQIELTNLAPSESARITDADVTLGTDGDDSGPTTLNETNFIFGLGGNDFLTPADSSLAAILVGDNLFLDIGTTPAGNDTLVGGSAVDLLIGDGLSTLPDASGNDILFGKEGRDTLIGDGQKVNATDAKGSDVFVYDRTIDNGLNETLIRFDLKTTPTAPFDTIRIIGTSDEGLQALAQSLTFGTVDLENAPNTYQFGIANGEGLPDLFAFLNPGLRGSGFFTKEDNTALTATTSVRLMAEITASSDPTQVGTPYEIILGTNSEDTTLEGSDNSNAIWGLSGNDILVGGGTSSNPNDLLVGGVGNDELYGDGILNDTGVGDGAIGGDDILDGGFDNDFLVGDGVVGGNNATGGNDILIGGFGINTLWGDFISPGSNVTGGDDIFVVDRKQGGPFNTPNIQNIMDFGVGNDTLRIINATGADRQGVVDILQGFTVNTTETPGTPFYQLLLPSATPENLPQDIRFTNLAVQQDTRLNFEFVTSGNHFESGEGIEVVFGTHLDDTGAFPIFGNVDANQADQIIFGFQGTNTIWGDAYNDLTPWDFQSSIPIGLLLTTQGGNDVIIGGDNNDNIGGDSGVLFGANAKGGDDFIFGGGGTNILAGDSFIDFSGVTSFVIDGAVGGADVFLFDAMFPGLSSNSIIDFNFMNAPEKEDSIRIFNMPVAGDELDFSDIHDQAVFGINDDGVYEFATMKDDGTDNNVVLFPNLPIPDPGEAYLRLKFEFSTDENFFTVDKTYDVILGTTRDDNVSVPGSINIVGTTSEDEIIYGLAGADTVFGDTDGILSTTGSNDLIDGGDGEDTLTGDALIVGSGGIGGNDIIYGGEDGDTIQGDAATILAEGKGGDDTLFGEDGNDTLYGDAVQNFGMGGNDTLLGGLGEDTLYGDAILNFAMGGNDTLIGGEGDDTLYGDGVPNISAGAIGGSDTFVYDLSIDNGTDTIGDFQAGDNNNPSIDRIRLQNVAASDPDNPTLEELYAAISLVELGLNTSGEYQINLNDAGAGIIKFAGLEMAPDTRMTFEVDTGTDGVDAEFHIFLASDSTSANLNTNTIGGLGSQIIYAGLNFDGILTPATPFLSLDPNYTVYGDLPTLSADGSDDIIVLNPFGGIIDPSSEALNIYGDGENPAGFMGGRDIFVWDLRNPDDGDLSGVQSSLRDFQPGMDGLESHDKIRVENLDNLTDLQNPSSPEATWNNVELAQVLNFDILGNLGNGNRYLIDDYTGIGFIELSNITPTAGTTVTFQLDSGTNGIDPNESEVNVILGTLGREAISGTNNKDEIIIGFGDNLAAEADTLSGDGETNAILSGQGSNDILIGGPTEDIILGDTLSLNVSNDPAEKGFGGDDYLIGGLGNDDLSGDSINGPNENGGTDRFVYDLSQEFGNDVINDFQTANIADGPGAISKDRLLLQNLPNLNSLPALLGGVEDLVKINNAGNYLFTWFSPDSTIELLNVAPEAGSIVTLELASGFANRLTPGLPINVVLGTNNGDNESNFSLLQGDPEAQPSTLQAIFGLDGDDQITGDKITVTSSDDSSLDILVGGKGLDELVGDGFTIFNGSVVNEASSDFIFGGDDRDEIVGDIRDNQGTLTNGGDDIIFAGEGDDQIYPDVKTGNLPTVGGDDQIDGGEGFDTIHLKANPFSGPGFLSTAVVVGPTTLIEAQNTFAIGTSDTEFGFKIIGNVERFVFDAGETSELILDITAGNLGSENTLVGDREFDLIIGADMNDTIYGFQEMNSAAFTTIIFQSDVLLGGGGDDTIVGDQGVVALDDLSGTASIRPGAQLIYGQDGEDTLIGDVQTLGISGTVTPGITPFGASIIIDGIFGTGADTILGGDDGDIIIGDVETAHGFISRGGDDFLFGEDGDDTIVGDVFTLTSTGELSAAGNDTINGGQGDDILVGDILNIAPGAVFERASDTFVFDFDPLGDSTGSQDNVSDSFGDDRIKDFIVGEDKLEFLNIPDFLGNSLDDLNALADLGFESFNGQDVLKVEFNQNAPTIDRGSIVFESIFYNPLNSDFTDYFTLGDVVASN